MRRDALAAPSTEKRTGPCGGRRAPLGPDQRSLGGQDGEGKGEGEGKGKVSGRGAALSELGGLVFR